MQIVGLTTCHNRRELTLRALRTLEQQSLPFGCNLKVCVVDDGSTDDTADHIRISCPDVVLIRGTGDLYWAGGMRYGWNEYARTQPLDYLLVFNDDISLHEDAISALLEVASCLESDGCRAFAVSGALVDPSSGSVAYGGAVRSSWWHPLRCKTIPPSGCLQDCDMLNMNFTLISRAALDLVGFLSGEFRHARADYDFSLRLLKLGGRLVLAPRYVGECGKNTASGMSFQSDILMPVRWRRLLSVKEEPPGERAAFYRRHGGLLWPFYWALPYLRTCLVSMRYYVIELPMVLLGFSKKKGLRRWH